MVELTVLGISLQGEANTPVLLLHPQGSGKILSVGIGPMEALSISTALHTADISAAFAGRGIEDSRFSAGAMRPAEHPASNGQADGGSRTPPVLETRGSQGLLARPMTHDFMLHLINALDGHLLGVEILRVENGVFFAEAVFSTHTRLVRLDCRPSDGIALALRCGAVIRAAEPVLAHAEDIVAVMESLPEHVRTVAAAKLTAETMRAAKTGIADFSRVPLVVEAALAAKDKFAQEDARSALRRAALKMREAEELAARSPNIRVSLVRQGIKGESEVLDEFQFPVADIPKKVLNSLVVPPLESGDTGETGGTDDERWAVLLRILSPETKVLM